MVRWWIAQAGLFLTVFAVTALSGPGRIDIVDGQTRYEVARSLVEHGDSVIRDPDVWFAVFPGREGQRYAKYRFPHSVIGMIAILAADYSGPINEGRRHFYFTMIGAVASAILAVVYASFFRHLGFGSRASLLWAAGGIFCTPNWFYGTTTFDDILGSTAVVLALVTALASRRYHPCAGATVAGLAMGLAFNCKEPLGIFILPVLSAVYDPDLGWQSQWHRLAIIISLLVLSVAIYLGYDLYKFPPGSTAGHAEIMKNYAPIWTDNPVVALLVMSFSLSAGVPFYNPAILICLSGFRAWWRRREVVLFVSLDRDCRLHPLYFLAYLLQGRPGMGSALPDSDIRRLLDFRAGRFSPVAPMGCHRHTRAWPDGPDQRALHRSPPPLYRTRPALGLLRDPPLVSISIRAFPT